MSGEIDVYKEYRQQLPSCIHSIVQCLVTDVATTYIRPLSLFWGSRDLNSGSFVVER